MIAKYDIEKNLKKLDKLFNKAKGKKEPLFFSKLAIIELCGWIEETVDNMIGKYDKKLTSSQSKTYLKEKIKYTYGFDYNKNIRDMLIALIGCINVDKIEANIDQVNFYQMKNILGNLKNQRDEEAHKHTRGSQRRIDAPSVTFKNYEKICICLKEIEQELKILIK